MYRNYTDEDIINFSKDVFSIAGLLRKLNLAPRGGNYKTVKRNLQRLNIDTLHWKGQAWSKEAKLKDWANYKKTSALRRHLINEIGYSCTNCGLDEWMGKPIPLELEHIDGDVTNNSRENITLLCCNCHALTPTWRRRK